MWDAPRGGWIVLLVLLVLGLHYYLLYRIAHHLYVLNCFMGASYANC